jgi:hypothetical protein
MEHENELSPHAFRDTLAGLVERYNEHVRAVDTAPDAGERKRAGDRRRRALVALERYASAVQNSLGDDGAALSGGYRRALETARAALPPAARGALDSLPLEDRRTWDGTSIARCPKCETVGELAADFGARLDLLVVPTDRIVTLRAAWLGDDSLPDKQRARIEASAPTPHPNKQGHSYVLGPYRQSNCYSCRAKAARAAREV